MILLKDILGQNNAVRYLVNSLNEKRISDSYLFSGPRGVGRMLTAKAFIMGLVCEKGHEGTPCGECSACKRIDTFDHPDLLYIKPEKNKVIKIDEIREAKGRMNLKPFEAPVSVCLIEDAHMITVEGANAMLKLLEEPPGESMLILVSDKKENILPTVVSRCTEVRFRALSIEHASSIIEKESGVSSEEAIFLAYFSQGSPGVALEMIEEDILTTRKESMAGLESILDTGNLSSAGWEQEKKDDLIEAADMIVMLLRDIVVGREGNEGKMLDPGVRTSRIFSFFEDSSIDHIYEVMEKIIQLKRALLGSANPKLVAQVLPGCLEEFKF